MALICFGRIGALMLRHLLPQFRDVYRILNVFFWPFFDALLWGFMSVWSQNARGVLFVPVIGSFFWQAVARTCVDMATSLMDELFSKNLVNIFSSPLRFTEFIAATTLISCSRMVVILVICYITILLCSGYNMFMFGWWLIPLMFSLCLSGWALGLLTSAMLLRWGMRAVEFMWVIGWTLSAFCGVFYPIDVLPPSLQMVGKLLPMTYTFTAIHGFVATGTMSVRLLGMGFAVTLVYCVAAVLTLHATFGYARNRGLARLEAE
jgi:ABC-2 type transport system permease protein